MNKEIAGTQIRGKRARFLQHKPKRKEVDETVFNTTNVVFEPEKT